MTHYRSLATARLTHTYHPGVARHLEWVVPDETARLLRRARALCKVIDGVMHFIYSATQSGAPIVPISGSLLRLGVRVTDTAFANVTAPASLPASGVAYWKNGASPTALDSFLSTRLVGAMFEHRLGGSGRPVSVSVIGESGTVWSEVVTAEQGKSSISIDLSGLEPGAFAVREDYPTTTGSTAVFLHAEFARDSLIGIVDLQVAPSFYSTPPAFEVALAAREETLRYYLVLDNHTPADLETLQISDEGATEDDRPEVLFDRLPPPFAADELPTSQLGGGPASAYVLFRSRSPVARRERARRRIELHRNGDLLIPHLPQPRPNQSDANIVIRLGK